jgi:hypothetical protein
MTRLLWDKTGERLYETGIDHGVLYLADGTGVPWNGLTGIEEDFGDDTSTPVYFDGINQADVPSIGDFTAKLTAFTYPDEFLEFEGVASLGEGFFVDDQDPKPFNLSYRTLLGNDALGPDFGYKLHLLYNLTAVVDTTSRETTTDSPNILEFTWNLSGVSQTVTNYRPTAHVIIDSTQIPSPILQGIEAVIYGDESNDAHLPTINELIDLASNWDPRYVVPNPTTGLSELLSGGGDLTPVNVDGVYAALPESRLIPSDVDGYYVLETS